MSILVELSEKLINGDDRAVAELTGKAIDDGLQPKQILDDGLIAGDEHCRATFQDTRDISAGRVDGRQGDVRRHGTA